MNKQTIVAVLCLFLSGLGFAQESEEALDSLALDSLLQEMQRIEASFEYQTGEIILGDDIATLTVPSGFKYLNAEQSNYVLTELWGNPPEETLGMLFPEDMSPLNPNMTFAIDITFSEDGYIEDDDAKDFDYDELLEEMKEDVAAGSEERVKAGYGSIALIGWAVPPYYDAEAKKLHWAKELKFNNSEENTLNYNIRILGRKGYLMLNVIGEMASLPLVQENIDPILASTEFNDGHKYSEFDPDLDEVAAYGIGGLIAGKVLAKAGFFALLLKFWKVIAVGAVAAFAGLKKFVFGSKTEEA